MKIRLSPRIYTFETTTRWTQKRKGILSSGDKRSIEIACPPEFGGHQDYWTAEHLFVASIETCIMTTFKWLIEKSKGKLIAYKSKAVGTAKMVNGDFKFSKVEIKPSIVVPDRESFLKAKKEIENADNQCLISKALNVKIIIKPEIKCDE
jgi:organic hydroperoxide reductase OsmC/OhrA